MLIATTATSGSATLPSKTCSCTPKAKSTKANSPTCGRAKASSSAWSVPSRKSFASAKRMANFKAIDADHQPRDQERLRQDQGEVDRRADGEEEEAEQQPLERLDVALQFVAVLAVGEHHAGQEGAQRRAQPHLVHQQRNADHQQQRSRHESSRSRVRGDGAEDRPQQEAPAQDDGRHRRQHGQRLRPGRQPGDQRRGGVGIAGVRVGTGRGRHVPASSGKIASMGMTAMSWKSSTAKEPARPRVLSWPCSPGSAGRWPWRRATASCPRPAPAARAGRAARRWPAPTAVVTTTCRPPSPRIGPRSRHSSDGSSSRPDEKEHHHHAELGEVHDVLAALAQQPEAEGADHHAGDADSPAPNRAPAAPRSARRSRRRSGRRTPERESRRSCASPPALAHGQDAQRVVQRRVGAPAPPGRCVSSRSAASTSR